MKTVCVTGASGFIAQHVVKELLEQGWSVHATVRDTKNEKKNWYLFELQKKHREALTLFEADLLKEGSFDESIRGVQYVIHTASPFLLAKDVKDPQVDLINPALKGTENVLKSVLKSSDSVKKVILTSSIAACVSPFAIKQDSVVDEKCWNTTSTMEEPSGSYRISKYKAETFAWKFCKENKITLTVICPTLVLGEVLNRNVPLESLNASAVMSADILFGKALTVSKMTLGYVDVRDVAQAHILAMDRSVDNQRFIVSSITMNWAAFVEYAKKYKEEFPNMTEKVDPKDFPTYIINNKRSIEILKVRYHNKEEMIDSMIDICHAHFLGFPRRRLTPSFRRCRKR
jgi:nucleoside-diphosphate-sugar epimerase